MNFREENMSSIEAEEMIKGEIKYKRDGRVDSLAENHTREILS